MKLQERIMGYTVHIEGGFYIGYKSTGMVTVKDKFGNVSKKPINKELAISDETSRATNVERLVTTARTEEEFITFVKEREKHLKSKKKKTKEVLPPPLFDDNSPTINPTHHG